MEGTLDTLPLVDLLEMLHIKKASGVLSVSGDKIPLRLQFSGGQVVSAAILDWKGQEALFSYPMHAADGDFKFVSSVVEGSPMMPFRNLLGEWARFNDQWARFLTDIDSPSRVLDMPQSGSFLDVFCGGKSTRNVAKLWSVPLVIAAERVWTGLNEGDLLPLRRYAWFGLKIRHPKRRRDGAEQQDFTKLLDGTQNLGQLIQQGASVHGLRRYLLDEIVSGEIRFAGMGWVVRDLAWELAAERPQLSSPN